MKDSLTVSVQEAIRICDELIAIVDVHIPTEVEAVEKFCTVLEKEENEELEAWKKLLGTLEWWEYPLDNGFSLTMPTFFQDSKKELERIKNSCMVTSSGNYTFSEDSLRLLNTCKDSFLVNTFADNIPTYKPYVSSYYRKLLRKRMEESSISDSPSESVSTNLSKEEVDNNFILFVFGVVFLTIAFILF